MAPSLIGAVPVTIALVKERKPDDLDRELPKQEKVQGKYR